MTTINNYSVSLAMDASSYIKESSLSRKETESLKREINSARDPMDKYERAHNLLSKALKEGAIDQATYSRLLDAATAKYDKATASTRQLTQAVENVDKKTVSYTSNLKNHAVAAVSAYASLQTLERGYAMVRERMLEIDAVVKSARGIGENANELQRFQFAVSELSGIDGEQAVTMLAKLNQRVGEASLGMGESAKYFKELGLNIDALNTMTPVEQFEALAAVIRKIPNPTEQAAYATKFFEESGSRLLPVLTATSAQYKESADQVDRLGLGISNFNTGEIEATNDAVGRLSASFKGLAQSLAEVAGSDALNALAGIVSAGGALNKIGQIPRRGLSIDDAKGIAAQLGINIKDAPEASDLGLLSPAHRSGAAAPKYTVGPRAKPTKTGTVDFTPDQLGGLIDNAWGKAADAIKSGGGGLMDLGGVFMSSANMIALSGAANTQELIKATKEDPAIKSLEVGTQEAYQYLTQATREQQQADRQEVERKKQLDANADAQRKKMNEYLDRISEAMEKNGFKRLR